MAFAFVQLVEGSDTAADEAMKEIAKDCGISDADMAKLDAA